MTAAGPTAALPVEPPEQLAAVLGAHLGGKVTIGAVAHEQGSSQRVAIASGSLDGRPGRWAIRSHDLASPDVERDHLALQAGVHALGAERGLETDAPLPSPEAGAHYYFDRSAARIYSVHPVLEGRTGSWERWAWLQRQAGVPEAFGRLQAEWDACFADCTPAELRARIPAADLDLLRAGQPRPAFLARLRRRYEEQTEPTARYDLASGVTNEERLARTARDVERLATRFPLYSALFGRWLPALEEWVGQMAEEQAARMPGPLLWLQHGDPSPTNSFFVPAPSPGARVHGHVDLELVRWSRSRSDLGVAASMRFGDDPDAVALAGCRQGRRSRGRLALADEFRRYLHAYAGALPRRLSLTQAELDGLLLGLKMNVMGLVFWSARMARARLLSDQDLERYLATQLHRLCLRGNTTVDDLRQAIGPLSGLVRD
ncbi:MAG TPA: hypothetical protein VOB72_21090 [Candidatus Dormibacteraeota bacterium]|nr:hypothetical protein [Candidatus Dormibacteraeota bacterium]